jgi:hypothetical protein
MAKAKETLTPTLHDLGNGYIAIGKWECVEVHSRVVNSQSESIKTLVRFKSLHEPESTIVIRIAGRSVDCEYKVGEFYILGWMPTKNT